MCGYSSIGISGCKLIIKLVGKCFFEQLIDRVVEFSEKNSSRMNEPTGSFKKYLLNKLILGLKQ